MTHTPQNPPSDPRRHRSSLRLTFRFDGNRIDLIGRQRLQKVAPGTTSPAPEPGKSSGAWIELRDSSGKRIFHRLLRDPLRTRAGHHSPDGRIELHVRKPQPCEFTAIGPDMPDVREAVLYMGPTEHERMHEAAGEVGRFSLVEKQPGPEGGNTEQDEEDR